MPAEATLAVARRGLFESYCRTRRSVWIEATGASMRPLITEGDWLLVDFGRHPSRIGEIVLFEREHALVAHRVVVRDGPTRLITKGDGTRRCDPPLAVDAVLGTVRARRRGTARAPSTFGCVGLPAWIMARLSLKGELLARSAALSRERRY